MLLVLLMLVIVVACVSVVVTYIQLNAEDWRWQWHSFLAGASVSLYVLLYSIVYFFMKTYMTGILQISYYFGYSLLLSAAIAMMTGSVGYFTAQAFVKAVYSGVKLD